MTNEELLAAIRLIVREELANVVPHEVEPDDLIVEGPDEDGRVKFKVTEEANPAVSILSHLTVLQAKAGRIAPLNMKQLATIMMNVGCNEDGVLQPAFQGIAYAQTGRPEIDGMSPFARKVKASPTFFQPNRFIFGDAFPAHDHERTVASRQDMPTLHMAIASLPPLIVHPDNAPFGP